ncbi:MAG TPA: hypothetical protein VK806_02555, partial [Bacteroidia bacterium]|nr:hypothetical protein [Bacteroidia bacterium]
MKRILPWLFLLVISVNRLSAQTKSTRVSSGPSPQMDASQSPTDRTEPGKVKWTAGPETMPGNIQAFQEYKGQFLNLANNWKILYGADYQGTKILFTDHGVIYTLVEKVANSDKDEDEGDKGKSAEEKNKEKQSLKKNVYHNVAIEWENVNAGLTVEAQDETPYYFGSVDPSHAGQAIDNIKGFKKLVYHNVYPGIDVEFTFHKNRGIKYAVIVHPGYNVSDFKMLYNGENEQLSIDENGNVHMPTAIGDLIDHAPISFQNGQKVESSFKKLSDNEVAFQLGKYDPNTDLVIDPWTVTALGTNFLPGDVGMDAANNVYIYGAGTDNYVQKYTAAGALSWTYTLTQYGTFSGYISDMAVDQAGNTYIPGPYPYTNGAGGDYTMLSLKPAGTLRYFNNTSPINSGSAAPNEIFEVWNVAYSCDFSELVEGGSPTVEQEDVGVVNSANGNVGGLTVKTTYGEIYAGTMAPNGNYYAIAANPCFGCSTPGDDIVCYTIAAGTATFSWNKQSVYQWNDFDTKNPDGIATNGIGASCAYLYTSDGKTLDQRSLTNGTVINTKTIPGGVNTDPSPSGIGVDLACGYVYAGTPTTVQVYDQNLNAITSQATPAEVRDVCYNNGLVAACGGTSSSSSDFVMVFTGQLCTTELTITHVNTSCGLNNGSATVATPTFCTGPYTYLWTPTGQTTQTATGLSAGVYTVNVGTSTSCVTVSDTVTIKPSTAETVTATATSGCTGSVSITVTGGVAPYTYSWSSGQTTSNITGVSAGSYTITVTDNSGCVRTATATVTGITLTVTPTQVNELCNGGNTASASVTATGGTAPYTYAWSNGKTSSNITGLSAGTYNVTVTESGGCTGTSSVTITQPTAITTTSSSTPAACTAPTGTASITAAGGTPGYTYSWNGGQTSSNITNVSGGTYTVTVTDANGCSVIANVTVAGSSVPITATTTPTNALCNGGTGSATVTAPTGGTAPYTYLWSNSQTTTTASPLSVGTYTVTITDNNGCSGPETVTIGQPTSVTTTPSSTPSNCTAAIGTATITPAGGTPGYTYSWNGGQTTSSISNLSSGIYTVVVTDANGCTLTSNVTVANTGATITPTITPTNVLCNGGNTGAASVTAAGGTTPYTYLWSNAQTSSNATVLTAGLYNVTVTDANGCSGTASITITQPTAVTATTTNTPALCFGTNGTGTVTAGGGTPGYTYSWSNAATSSTMSATAGTYVATVTDANGCVVTANTTITQPTALSITAAGFPASCFGSCDGQVAVIPSG